MFPNPSSISNNYCSTDGASTHPNIGPSADTDTWLINLCIPLDLLSGFVPLKSHKSLYCNQEVTGSSPSRHMDPVPQLCGFDIRMTCSSNIIQNIVPVVLVLTLLIISTTRVNVVFPPRCAALTCAGDEFVSLSIFIYLLEKIDVGAICRGETFLCSGPCLA